MSGYRYDYPLARAPRSLWRSAFTTIAAAATIAIVSGIGGAAVVLELVAPPKGPADTARMSSRERAALSTTVPLLSTTVPLNEARNDAKIIDESKAARDAGNRPSRVIASGAPAPAAPDEKSVRSTAVAPPAPAVDDQPSAAVAPPPGRAVAAQATAAAAPAQSNPPAEISAGDLTFAKGYAKRRAAREAAMKAAGLEPRKEDVKKGDATEAKESKDSKEAKDSKEVRKSEKVARARHRGTTETAYYRNRSERGDYSDRYERYNDRYGDRYNDRYHDRYAERFERRDTSDFGDDFQRPARRGMFGNFF